jgi:uncharacterized protein YjbJ (UPF0337 family)
LKGYDEPEILPSSTRPICLIGADGGHKEQWGHLTDDDLDKIAGKREQLEGKIQERAGITKDAARKSVDDWLNKQ